MKDKYLIVRTTSNKVKDILIPESGDIIDDSTLDNPSSRTIREITIPSGVISLEDRAFSACSRLEKLVISDTVKNIKSSIVDNCEFLEEIIVSSKNKVFDSRDNCHSIINTKKNELIVGCSESFIPKSIVSIGNGAFSYCLNLEDIIIPEGIKEIKAYAFSCCVNLKRIIIPASVTHIEGNCFSVCTSLESIQVDPKNRVYDSRNDCNAIIHTASNELIAGCKNTIIPDTVVRIGDSAFFGCEGLEFINIPNSVTSLGEYVFTRCTDLKHIQMGDNITKFGKGMLDTFASLGMLKICHQLLMSEYGFNNQLIKSYKDGKIIIHDFDLYYEKDNIKQKILRPNTNDSKINNLVYKLKSLKNNIHRRIKEEDMTFLSELENIPQEQFMYCLHYANEVKSINLLAAMIDYSNKHNNEFINEYEINI